MIKKIKIIVYWCLYPFWGSFRKNIYHLTGKVPLNIKVYKYALKHRSTTSNTSENNERLEFLGDAYLESIISEYLFKKYPARLEGFLSSARARLVNRDQLNEIAISLRIDILMENITSFAPKANIKFIYGNALEALIAAIYLDRGYDCCKKFIVFKVLGSFSNLDQVILQDTNYKSKILVWGDKNKSLVNFQVQPIQETNPIVFESIVYIDDDLYAKGKGYTKKEATQKASKAACDKLGLS